MIINGMAYTVSKESPIHASFKEIKAPIGGRIAKILVNIGTEVRKEQVLFVLEAMKIEIDYYAQLMEKRLKKLKS